MAYRIEEGGWGGGGYQNEGGTFAFCFIGTKTGAGTRVGVFLFSDASLWLTIANDAWSLRPGTSYAASIEVDDTVKRSLRGEVKSDSVIFDLNHDPVFFDAMRNGKELWFVGASDNVGIALRPDSFAALTALESCIEKHAGSSAMSQPSGQGAGSPFDGPAPAAGASPVEQNPFAPSASGSGAAETGEAEETLRRLLVELGYPAPEVRDVSDSGIGFHYAWTSKHSHMLGFLAIEAPATDVRAALMEEIAALSEICGGRGGQPLYDTIVRSVSGDAIYSGRAECGRGGGAVYFALSASQENVLLFMHIAEEGDRQHAQQINGNLRNYLRRL